MKGRYQKVCSSFCCKYLYNFYEYSYIGDMCLVFNLNCNIVELSEQYYRMHFDIYTRKFYHLKNTLLTKFSDIDEKWNIDWFISVDAKKDVVDSLLRASGCLDYCVHRILVQMPAQVKYAWNLKCTNPWLYITFYQSLYGYLFRLALYYCRKSFPSYFQEGMLEAISIQALAQVVKCLLYINPMNKILFWRNYNEILRHAFLYVCLHYENSV